MLRTVSCIRLSRTRALLQRPCRCLSTGTLFAVATPIGNLQDASARVISTLQRVEVVAAESSEVLEALKNSNDEVMNPFQKVQSFYAHNEEERMPELLAHLREGHDVAITTRAGTVGICDVGARLIKAAHAEGISVSSIPGPCSITAALAASGVETHETGGGGFPLWLAHEDLTSYAARLTWSEKGVLMLWELSTETVGAEPRFGSWAEALLMARGQGRHGGALMLPRLTYDGVVGGAVHLDEGQTPSAIYAANGAPPGEAHLQVQRKFLKKGASKVKLNAIAIVEQERIQGSKGSEFIVRRRFFASVACLLEITQHSKAGLADATPKEFFRFFATCDAKRADIWMKALQSAAMEDAQHGPHGMRTMRTTAKHESKCHNV
ncbi:unnamed protein product [Durusdinium trenchii]|uniref:Tetrapyrrole methylase domain-containing protein n=1 Tax=Durusdinium trenchii TaxID=1381693 RepID=A0ABP0LX90_9DINO